MEAPDKPNLDQMLRMAGFLADEATAASLLGKPFKFEWLQPDYTSIQEPQPTNPYEIFGTITGICHSAEEGLLDIEISVRNAGSMKLDGLYISDGVLFIGFDEDHGFDNLPGTLTML